MVNLVSFCGIHVSSVTLWFILNELKYLRSVVNLVSFCGIPEVVYHSNSPATRWWTPFLTPKITPFSLATLVFPWLLQLQTTVASVQRKYMFTVTLHNVYHGIPFLKPRYTTFLTPSPPRPPLKFPTKTSFPLSATTTNYGGQWSTYVIVYHIFSHRLPWYTVLKNSVYHIYYYLTIYST